MTKKNLNYLDYRSQLTNQTRLVVALTQATALQMALLLNKLLLKRLRVQNVQRRCLYIDSIWWWGRLYLVDECVLLLSTEWNHSRCAP